ncbi:MAG: hypothetical protein V4439_01885 [Patescibacteria group bacterium]
MLENDNEKLNRLEDLKMRLVSKGYRPEGPRREIFIPHRKQEVPDSWKKEEDDDESMEDKFFTKTSMFKKFFIFSIIFFVLACGLASYFFFFGGNTVSNDNIDIAVLGNTFTAGGEELPLQIEITNKNNTDLQLVDMVLEYPKGTADQSGNTEHFRQSLGTIPAGSIHTENVKIILFGEQNSIQPVKISLEYRVEGSNAIFVKEKDYEVSISSAPINLSVDAPAEVSPNQDVTLNIKATLNATKTASKMLLKIDYPIGFQFENATPSPFSGNNVWNLGDLAPGSETSISVTGKMVDVSEGEDKTFHIWSGSQSETDKSVIGVVFSSLGQTINIKKPFIAAQLFVNGVYQREYAADSKTPIRGEIRWVNNLPVKMNDLVIKAKISGNAMDRKTITSSQGFYDSTQDTIVWDKNSDNNFSEVSPGDRGTVSFSVLPLPLFSGGGMLVDPSIKIDVSIAGKQALSGNALQELNNSESKIVRIISDVGFANKALYYSGPFTNTGPIPPKVEKETTYTIVWSLSNTANNISKAQVRATLPEWINFVGHISPDTEDLTFNSGTKEIVWNVGGIPKGTGITEADREVAFQVSLTPSLSQVGTAPVIINDATLTGHDDFANVDVRVNKTSLNTKLSSDSAAGIGSERVSE